MVRYELLYDKEQVNHMKLFDKVIKYSGVRVYLHNVSTGIIGAEITDSNSLESIKGLSEIIFSG